MARISESELQHITQAISLVSLVKKQGHALIEQEQNFLIWCPFKTEPMPTMVINTETNRYHCPACQAEGSVLDWVMKTEKLSQTKAYARLQREMSGNPVAEPFKAVESVDNAASRQTLLNEVLAFYQHTLLTAPEAQYYLQKRKLNQPELVSHFRLGYANRTLAYRLPPKALQAGAKIRSQLQQLGIMRKTGHEHLHGSLVIPVISATGQIGEVYGRKINHDLRKGTPKHIYLGAEQRGIFNEEALLHHQSIILCQSLLDALSFWVAGQRNVTASYGVDGMTAEHWQLLADNQVKHLLIAFGNNAIGNQAAIKLAAELLEQGIAPWRVLLPANQDVNDYLCAQEEPETAFKLLIDSAVPMSRVVQPVAVVPDDKEPIQTLPALAITPVTEMVGLVSEWQENGDLQVAIGQRQWRLRGLPAHRKNSGSLKINLQVVEKISGSVFSDHLDLFSARSRQSYARQAGIELSIADSELRTELAKLLLVLENPPLNPYLESYQDSGPVELNEQQRDSALALLQDPQLIQRISDDLASCGVVGESSNLLAAYLAATSRKLERPLAVLIQSSSAAGKSSLMEAVLNLIPSEERLQYSAMTGQSLFYLGETNLQHKILAIAEEEGVRQAAYALKLLQSDGELTIASTGKDDNTGNLVTKQYTVKGPVMLMLTTTAIDIDEELLNRCLVLSVNESREQTEAIHALQRQRQTLDGLLMDSEKSYLTELHQNAQRLIKPLTVVNPFAQQLTFTSDKTRSRRDHMKYLTLIQSITLLHQYQREVKTLTHRGQAIAYIEVNREDIQLANQLAHEILGRTLDEMPPQTRKLLLLLQGWVAEQCWQSDQRRSEVHFSRKQVRDALQWGDTQLKIHLNRLVEMEYLLLHKRGLTFSYELLYDAETTESRYLCGLLDVKEPESDTMIPTGRDKEAIGRPLVGPQSGGGRGSDIAFKASTEQA